MSHTELCKIGSVHVPTKISQNNYSSYDISKRLKGFDDGFMVPKMLV